MGSVWVGLFIAMAFARWMLLRTQNERLRKYNWLIAVLIVFCGIYPFYAIAPGSNIAGLIGNILTIALALFVAWKVWQASRLAASLVLLVVIWVSFASISVVDAIRLGQL